MNKPFYSDYVRHAMRFYSRNVTISYFKSEVDKLNWLACQKAINVFSERDKDILISVYQGFDTLPDNVYEVAKKYNIDQTEIWDMIKDLERKIAKRRKLI